MFFDFQVAGKVHTAAWTLRCVDAGRGQAEQLLQGRGHAPLGGQGVVLVALGRVGAAPVRRARSSRLRGVCAESTNSTTSTL